MQRSERHDQRNDVTHALRLRHEQRRKLFDRIGMPPQVLLEIHVHEIGRERANLFDPRILRPPNARQREPLGKDAEVGDANDRVTDTELEERLGDRRNERDDAAWFVWRADPADVGWEHRPASCQSLRHVARDVPALLRKFASRAAPL